MNLPTKIYVSVKKQEKGKISVNVVVSMYHNLDSNTDWN
jgi:hypothetical protein